MAMKLMGTIRLMKSYPRIPDIFWCFATNGQKHPLPLYTQKIKAPQQMNTKYAKTMLRLCVHFSGIHGCLCFDVCDCKIAHEDMINSKIPTLRTTLYLVSMPFVWFCSNTPFRSFKTPTWKDAITSGQILVFSE